MGGGLRSGFLMLGLINFILNVAGILLWLSWLSVRFDPLAKSTPATLVGTLRRAEPHRLRRWYFLAGLLALLVLRSAFYRQIGSAVGWTPSLHLAGIGVAIPFRSDRPVMLLYSFLSFGGTLGIFYLWLLLPSLVNNRTGFDDPTQKLIRLQLGRIDRLPWVLKALLPLVGGLVAWYLVSLLLSWLHLIPKPYSELHRLEQAAVVGLGCYLHWKYLIGVILALYLVSSYVYFGNQPFWNFVTLTGRNLLAPISRLPLQIGRVDCAPVLGVVLVFLGAYLAESRWGLPWLYKHLPL